MTLLTAYYLLASASQFLLLLLLLLLFFFLSFYPRQFYQSMVTTVLESPSLCILHSPSLSTFPALQHVFAGMLSVLSKELQSSMQSISESLFGDPVPARATPLARLPALRDLLFAHALVLKITSASSYPELLSNILPSALGLSGFTAAAAMASSTKEKQTALAGMPRCIISGA